MTVGTDHFALLDFVFNCFNTNCRVGIPCEIMLLLAIYVIKIHLTKVIGLATICTETSIFNVTNIFFVSVPGFALAGRFGSGAHTPSIPYILLF